MLLVLFVANAVFVIAVVAFLLWVLSRVYAFFFFFGRPYSDATAEKMDLEAREMVDSAYQRTLKLVEDKKEQVGRAVGRSVEPGG